MSTDIAMEIGSLNKTTQLIQQIVEGWILVKQFGADFESELGNFLTTSEKFFSIFVAIPVDYAGTYQENVNTIRVRVYCHGQIQADRSNVVSVVSDSQLILADLWRKLLDSKIEWFDLVGDGLPVNENNSRLDYLAGSYLDLEFMVTPATKCAIPTNEEYDNV